MKYLGIDVGTTGVKAAVFSADGIMCGYGVQMYPILFSEKKHAEQDALQVWEKTKQAIRTAAIGCGEDIAALSISVQGDAIIPLDREKRPLHNCLLGMDYRGEAQADQCKKLLGDDRLFQLCGMRSHPLNSISKIMWFMQERPDIHEKTWKYVTYADFMMLMLGADEPVVDYTMASRYMAMSLKTHRWSAEILNAIGLSEDKLSVLCAPGTVVGTVPQALADELGLKGSTSIVAGGHDQSCAALGAGLVGNNEIALDSHGTAEVLSVAFDAPILNRCMFDGYYPCTCYVQSDRYFTFALNHTGGILFQWFKDNLCVADREKAIRLGIDEYSYLIGNMNMDKPSGIMVLPHFNGSGTPICDMDSMGAIVGLTMDASRYDIGKAIMEALCFEMKLNLMTLRESGIAINRIRCVGGAARSEPWLQLKADIMNMDIETLQTREAACLGAAMIASVGTGMFDSYETAAEYMIYPEKIFHPIQQRVEMYAKKYNIYRDLYHALRPIHSRLIRH